MGFGDKLLVGQFLRLLDRGVIPSRLMIKISLAILRMLVKKTSNKLDDKVVDTVEKLLIKKR
tara:strand:+ start:297 stop:482 length:186 start_codon:yes stop_codon:yes gene_type:complete